MTTRCVLIIALAVLLTAPTVAVENTMGLYFSETEFGPATVNSDVTDPVPFSAWIVLTNATVESVSVFELGFSHSPSSLMILSCDFGTDGQNFDSCTNMMVGYSMRPRVVDGSVVLGRLTMLLPVTEYVELFLGPASPSTIPGSPVIGHGDDPYDFIACAVNQPWGVGGPVATINGCSVATEPITLTTIKALFHQP